jgi:hypothetical protein
MNAWPSSRALTRDVENLAVIHSSSTYEWYVEKVDTAGYGHTSLALDESGRPHISYYDATNKDLKYAWYTGTAWLTETVDTEGDVGQYASLALDESGRPHISYYDATNKNLKYAWYTGTAWLTETVDIEGNAGLYTSLALDESGHPHISYKSDSSLKYAKYTGTAWETEKVDGFSIEETSLALDELGRPHISYQQAGSSLGYAWYDGVAWHIETVREGVYMCEWGYDSSLALDESGYPHIIYHGEFYCSGGLMYAWFDGNAWQDEWVPFSGSVIEASLALDESGRPYISYYGASDWDLKYGWRDETGWHIETVDSAGNVGRFPSIALDTDASPHISYYDFTNHDLKYAHLLPALLLHKHATPMDGLLNSDHLTYILTVSGPALDVYLWDPLPESVLYISGSIASTLSPLPVYSPTARSIFWEGTLLTDTVTSISFQVTPDITGTEPLSLSLPVVNTAWLTDTRHNKSVSATIIVNGWHAYLPLIFRLK